MQVIELLRFIEDNHHALLKRELPRLDVELRAQGAPDSLLRPLGALTTYLENHLAKEENILFPNIARLAAGEELTGCGVLGPITQMHHEHEDIRKLEQAVRVEIHHAGDLGDALLALLDDLAVHATREDDQLFPAALALERGEVAEKTHEPTAGAHEVVAMLTGAEAFHTRFRSALGALDTVVLDADPTARFTAPWAHFTRGIRDHFGEEETVLFPALRALAGGREPADASFQVHLDEMQYELDEIRTISDALRSAAPELADHEQQLLSMLDELEEHARREEENLYPAARAMVAAWRGEPIEPTHRAYAPPPRPEPEQGRGLLRRTAHRVRGLLRR